LEHDIKVDLTEIDCEVVEEKSLGSEYVYVWSPTGHFGDVGELSVLKERQKIFRHVRASRL
jgi:hypothetical protein